jgi:hypothetical protein
MVFAALLLLSPVPLFGDVVLPVSNPAAIVSSSNPNYISSPARAEKSDAAKLAASEVTAENSAPSMPQPRINSGESSSAEPVAAAAAQPRAFAFEPVKPAAQHSYENRNQKRIWYGLVAAGHAGAAFDAWSTRRALSGNYGTESDPLMRPFAHSGAVYAATQVTPLLMDLIGKRAMVSEHMWVRRLWWVPQSVGATLSFTTAVHNVGVVR